jgi:hypothetical protein
MTDNGTKSGPRAARRTTARRRTTLSDDDLQRLLELSRKADSV